MKQWWRDTHVGIYEWNYPIYWVFFHLPLQHLHTTQQNHVS